MSDFTFKKAPKHEGAGVYMTYAKAGSPLPTPVGFNPDGFIGRVHRCETRFAEAPCKMTTGAYCLGWHFTTFTTQLQHTPDAHGHSYRTREAAAQAMLGQQEVWAAQLRDIQAEAERHASQERYDIEYTAPVGEDDSNGHEGPFYALEYAMERAEELRAQDRMVSITRRGPGGVRSNLVEVWRARIADGNETVVDLDALRQKGSEQGYTIGVGVEGVQALQRAAREDGAPSRAALDAAYYGRDTSLDLHSFWAQQWRSRMPRCYQLGARVQWRNAYASVADETFTVRGIEFLDTDVVHQLVLQDSKGSLFHATASHCL